MATSLDEYLTTRQAGEILRERLGLPWMDFNDRIDKEIFGIDLGERPGRWSDEELMPVARFFTRNMLERYIAGERPVHPTEEEVRSIVSVPDAADMLGVKESNLNYHIYQGNFPDWGIRKVGRVRIISREALREYAASQGIKLKEGENDNEHGQEATI